MSPIAPGSPPSDVRPRPGVVKTLGVANVVFSLFNAMMLFSSLIWIAMAFVKPPEAPKVEGATTIAIEVGKPPGNPPQKPMMSSLMFMGMDDPKFLNFVIVDTVTGFLFAGLMFATGIGLLNLKPWAARWWFWLSWANIVRSSLLGAYFIIEVSPSLSESMAHGVVTMLRQQGVPPTRILPLQEFVRMYSIVCLIVGIGMIVFGSLYPTLSIWLLGRPGVKAALAPRTSSLEFGSP